MIDINPYNNHVLSLKNNNRFYIKLCFKFLITLIINFSDNYISISILAGLFFGYLLKL